MKKSILSALALATMVGACTNEEFEVVQNAAVPGDVTALNGRAKGELTLTAGRMDINEEATRVDGSISDVEGGTAIDWYWRDGNDKLGGVVVDYKNAENDIVDLKSYPAYAITNYPFAPGISAPSKGADFSTPTAVVNGAYFFYSQYDGQNTSRRTISDKIARLQTVGHGREAGLVQIGSSQQDGGENFFVSPIVNVAVADGSNIATPLALTSAHGVLHITLDADLESKYIGENGLSVHKVVLQTVNENSKFSLQTTVDPAQLGIRQKEVYDILVKNNSPIRNAFILKNDDQMAVVDGKHSLAKEAQEEVLKYLTRKAVDGVPVIGTQSAAAADVTPDLVYQLEEPFVYTSSDSEMELFVILPTGTYAVGEGDLYNGLDHGALRMTVYTSEGTYDCYLSDKKDLTVYRNQKINVSRTLKIKADETNINLFDPNEGFKIETTEDYEYAIDYINAHYRDFGNSSDWKAPILNFVTNPTTPNKIPEIEVKEGYYFPNFRTIYKGEAVLKLNVANGSSYVFDPVKTIFDSQAKPTIVIEDKTSSISFAAAIPAANGTQSVELESAGDVNVAHNIVFDELNSEQALNIAKKVTVTIADTDAAANGALNIGDEAKVNAAGKLNTNSVAVGKGAQLNVTTELTTEGTVLLDEGATANASDYISNAGTTTMEANSELNVAAKFDNSADITIKGTAVATLGGESTNDGDIIVEGKGKLVSTSAFTNKKNGLVEVREVQITTIDDKARGIAEFKQLENQAGAKVIAKAGVDLKGTYGALITVGNEQDPGELKNAGEISINGELDAEYAKTANSGTITLESNPYARILLNGANASLTDKDDNGSLVLAAPAVYEMFDNFFTGRNKLTDATGVIETTLDQATYDKVLANYKNKDLFDQERALVVLNKITVTGELKVEKTQLADVDFVLPANAKLVAKESMEFNSLTADGKSSLATNLPWPNVANVTISERVDVNADFAVESRVNVKLLAATEYAIKNSKPVAYDGVLNLNKGTFTNYGSIHGSANGAFFATIDAPATLKNNGVIGTYNYTAAVAKVITKYSATELAEINALNKAYNDHKNSYYIRELVGTVASDDKTAWGAAPTRSQFTFPVWKMWVSAGCPSYFTNGNYSWKIYLADNGKYEPVPAVSTEISANINKVYPELNENGVKVTENLFDGRDTEVTDAIKGITAAKPEVKDLKDYIIVRNNYGTFDMLSNGIITVGGIVDNNKGTKKGEFSTNVLETGLVTIKGVNP